MIFSGGGFKTAMYLGMYQAARDQNLNPDIIIGTCGGSISAAIAHSILDPEKLIEFLQSQNFYQFMKSIEINRAFQKLMNSIRKLSDFNLIMATIRP